jgi:hypothetical protein
MSAIGSFYSETDVGEFAGLVASGMSTTITLEEFVGTGEAAEPVIQGSGIPARKQKTRSNITQSPTTGPAGLGARDMGSYICQTALPVRSGWRLTDELTGGRHRVLGNLTDAGWPYVQLRVEAWN